LTLFNAASKSFHPRRGEKEGKEEKRKKKG